MVDLGDAPHGSSHKRLLRLHNTGPWPLVFGWQTDGSCGAAGQVAVLPASGEQQSEISDYVKPRESFGSSKHVIGTAPDSCIELAACVGL